MKKRKERKKNERRNYNREKIAKNSEWEEKNGD